MCRGQVKKNPIMDDKMSDDDDGFGTERVVIVNMASPQCWFRSDVLSPMNLDFLILTHRLSPSQTRHKALPDHKAGWRHFLTLR